MANVVIPSPHVALNLTVSGNFGAADAPSSKNARPLHLASRGIQGQLVLEYDSSALPIQSKDVVKVTLSGSSSIRKPWKDPRSMVMQYTQLQSSFLNLVDTSRVINGEPCTDKIHVSFRFILPKVVSLTSQPDQTVSNEKQSLKWNSLPSSLAAESVSTTDMNGGAQSCYARIAYTLTAQVFRRSVPMGHTTMAIRIYNDMDAQPPICMTDFPLEYRCLHQKPLTRYFRKTGAFFTATTTEPCPFIFSSEEDSALTTLSITIAYHRRAERQCDGVRKPTELIGATFLWQIKSLTFLSTQPVTSMPTAVLPGRQTSISMITVLDLKHQLNWQLSPRQNSSTTRPELSGSTWTESFKLPLVIDKAVLPVPSVLTPYICRRYNLVLWIKLEGPYGDKTNLRLEVPVQIAYRQEEGSLGGIGLPPPYESWDESEPENGPEMEAPIYSP